MPLLSVAVAAGGFLFAPMAGNGALAAIMNLGAMRLEVEYDAVTPVALLGRMKTASASLTADLSPLTYRIAAYTRAEGMLDWFVDSTVAVVSTGAVTPLGLVPGHNDSSVRDGAKHRHIVLDFTPGEVLTSVSPKFGDWGFPATTHAQKLEAMDPLSALIDLTLRIDASQANPCGGPLRIFDGKQRYDLRLKFAQRFQWKSDAYKGPAIKCTVEYVEIAGFDPKSAEDKEADRADIEWANFILAELNGGTVTPPIKAELRSKRSGKYTIEATRLKYGPAR